VVGAPGLETFIDPLIVWKKTSPPSGITFYRGGLLSHLKNDLFVATLRSEALIRIRLGRGDNKNDITDIERWFEGKYGRLRDVVEDPDGALYLLTNNRDGRGKPQLGDDKIYRILPK
jgi:glucose/arabinose dehydrogenase